MRRLGVVHWMVGLVGAMTFAQPMGGAESRAAKKAKRDETVWTLGFYAGPSPFALEPAAGAKQPVFAATDTGDADLDTVAHPFLAIEGGRLHAFFTAKNIGTGRGGIGHAESSDGLSWKYHGLVLRGSSVLSYPFVFKAEGEYYMLPESSDNVLRLHRATRFPDQWTFVCDLLQGDKLVSPTLLRHGDRWWLFVGSGNATLRLFQAESLRGPWHEHPRSPVVPNDANIARPAGRPLIVDGKLYRLAQDCEPTYGNRVVAFEITRLTATDYREVAVEKPLVAATSVGWNSGAMHHIDAHRVTDGKWIAIVDARGLPVR